jgi:hypothetical protein
LDAAKAAKAVAVTLTLSRCLEPVLAKVVVVKQETLSECFHLSGRLRERERERREKDRE